MAPVVSNYPVCAAFPGNAGGIVEITCAPAKVGRYVIVQLQATEYLTLCEVEVFGSEVNILKPGKANEKSDNFAALNRNRSDAIC